MIVLDTTVLVYAKGASPRFRDPCRQLIEAAAEGRVRATTTVEVIQEFVHVRARRSERSDAATLGSDYAELLSPLLVVQHEQLEAGLSLFRGSERLGAFDAVLAATATAAQASALISADAAFADVSGIRHVVPDGPGVAEVLQPG